MKKRFIKAAACLLAMCLPAVSLAAVVDHDLSLGNLVVTADSENPDGYRVYQSLEGSTSYTITIGSGAKTNITLDNVNIDVEDKSGVDIQGNADVTLVLKGTNRIEVSSDEDGAPAIHVSGGTLTIGGNGSLDADTDDHAGIGSKINEDMSGSITIEDGAFLNVQTDEWDYDSAGIGSGHGGNMKGTIIIQGSANVISVAEDGNGAGIGSGENGEMSGKIIIRDNAVVYAEGDDDGAGIGSGEDGEMSGSILITGNAQVNASSDDRGAGIGSGEDADVTGSITINGNATVIAESLDDDAAGIGGGEEGKIAETGIVTIGGNAKVTAKGQDEGAGVGSGEDEKMEGTIIIKDNAVVYAYGGECAAAIGTDGKGDMTGTIMITGNAQVITGVLDDDGNIIDGEIGYIGGGDTEDHDSSVGSFIIGSNVTINGVKGSDIEKLKGFVNMELDEDGNPTNLTIDTGDSGEPVNLYRTRLWNEKKDISVQWTDYNGVKALVESGLSDGELALLQDGSSAELLKACRLAFEGEYEGGEFILNFHLGSEFAGKKIELRQLTDGTVRVYRLRADARGTVGLMTDALGGLLLLAR